ELKELSDIPVVGNGDINSVKQGKELVKKGFCDSFMIGRASLSNPLVFEGKKCTEVDVKKKIFNEYLEICKRYEALEPQDIRLKALELFRGFEGSAMFRNRISKSKSIEKILEYIKEFNC
ncbi:tRNA-dihydrouridine synthase, partial [Candidatus Micrarchaeota archaeon]|nr:tRNA-dihydrouridine synthase [Candidatus Micrarchaeota archaeon]